MAIYLVSLNSATTVCELTHALSEQADVYWVTEHRHLAAFERNVMAIHRDTMLRNINLSGYPQSGFNRCGVRTSRSRLVSVPSQFRIVGWNASQILHQVPMLDVLCRSRPGNGTL